MEKRIIICNCEGGLITPENMEFLKSSLKKEQIPFDTVTDLCGVSVTNPQAINELVGENTSGLIVACYPRAVKLILERIKINANPDLIEYLNFRDESTVSILNKILLYAQGAELQDVTNIENDSNWPSWYPVIDYSRCTACGQCADFCLFGVYTKTDQKVEVVHPQACKNNCPACARICPHTAIVFPKYNQGGAIAGSDTIDEIAEQERQHKDIDAILGSDIYKALEQRKAKRQALIKSEALKKAMEEREKALREKQ